jgi:heme oxygenase
MRPHHSLRDDLRVGTHPHHQQIDALLGKLNLACTADYVRFLDIHAEALSQLGGRTPISDRGDTGALLSCLQADLQFYGKVRSFSPLRPAEESFARQLGIAYVIRGSRLGAKVLMRRVGESAPTAYLGYAPETTWANFLQVLDSFSLYQPPDAAAECIEGAKAAFRVFSTSRSRQSSSHSEPMTRPEQIQSPGCLLACSKDWIVARRSLYSSTAVAMCLSMNASS